MKNKPTTPNRTWYKAKLTPMAQNIFTESFYPKPKRGSGDQHVYFTQIDITPTTHKVVVASRMEESAVRMMTLELASTCLIPQAKATRAEMATLNEISANLKT